MLASQPLTTHAQNLFRTGRPDYARPAPSNVGQAPFAQPRAIQPLATNQTSDYWNQPWVSQSYGDVGGGSSAAFDPRLTRRPPTAGSADYDRLQAAWENYRREALRYQGQSPARDDRPFTANSSNPSYVPLGYASDWRPSDVVREVAPRRTASRETFGNSGSGHQCEYRRRLENAEAGRQNRFPDRPRRGLSPADTRPTLESSYRPSQYQEPARDDYRRSPSYDESNYEPSYQQRRSNLRAPLEPVPMSFSPQRKQANGIRNPVQNLDPARVASRIDLY